MAQQFQRGLVGLTKKNRLTKLLVQLTKEYSSFLSMQDVKLQV
jgi:hypothetical protein